MAKRSSIAPGPMAGYLFQPDRALVLLCSCRSNESVSIELVDDVAVVREDGTIVYREQTKHSIKAKTKPFKSRHKDLWQTLDIWCRDIATGKLEIDNVRLACVTNKKLATDSLLSKIAAANSGLEADKLIEILKKSAKKPPKGLKTIMNSVLSNETTLRSVLVKITAVDGSSFESRTDEIAEKLNISADLKEPVIQSLRGWLNEVIIKQLEKGNSPIISKEDFVNRFVLAVKKEGDDRFVIMAKKFVLTKISKDEIGQAIDRNFVRQLDLIEHFDKHDIIVDAIDDFLCAESERTRLTLKGDITRDELESLDDTSKERWKDVFRRVMKGKSKLNDDELSTLAFDIYSNTIENYLCKIRGHETELYFTRGSFHKLADDLEIGWHPNWRSLINRK